MVNPTKTTLTSFACLFVLTLAAGPAFGQSFELRRTETQAAVWGYGPRLIAGDFDGSGSEDLVIITDDCTTLRVLMNPLSSAPATLVINPGVDCGGLFDEYLFDPGDIDGDGFDDVLLLVTYTNSSNDLYLYRGSPTGLQVPGALILSEINQGVTEVVATDLDGDGRKDLHIYLYDWWYLFNPQGNFIHDGVRRYRQTPQGQFVAVSTWNSGLTQKAVAGDVHGDGREDVIGFRSSIEFILIGGHSPNYFNMIHEELQLNFVDANGAFQTAFFPHQIGNNDCLLRACDWNSDGRTDIAVLGQTTPLVQIFLGDPIQGLIAQSPMALPMGLPTSRDLHVGDFDADLRTDLVLRSSTATGASLFRGDGMGHLSQGFFALPSLQTPLQSEVMEDLDGDGDIDWALFQLNNTSPPSLSFQVFENRARFGQTCAGSQGTPELAMGVAAAGNPNFFLELQNAAPGALEQLFIATAARTIDDTLCGARFDSNALILPPLAEWFTTSTDANGFARQSFALPLGLTGQFILQWAVVDPLGSFQTNNGTRVAATAARTIAIF